MFDERWIADALRNCFWGNRASQAGEVRVKILLPTIIMRHLLGVLAQLMFTRNRNQ
jgi:hypothetical protein